MSALRAELCRLAAEWGDMGDGVFRNVYDLVAREGIDYMPREVPVGLRRRRARRPKNCYGRAFSVALDRPDLIYVEGFALGNFGPIRHAWLTEGSGCAIDLAWKDPAVEYIGVPLATASLARATTNLVGDYLSDVALWRDGFGPTTIERAG
jgi:hypothetical protein